jgi:hypothetical protein
MSSLINCERPSWILGSGSIYEMGDTWCKHGYSGSKSRHLGFEIADVINFKMSQNRPFPTTAIEVKYHNK